MTPPAANRPPVRLAADLAKSLPLSDAAKTLLAPTLTPRQFFDLLAAHPPLAEDAIRFLAVALPKREAVGWGLACVRVALPTPSPVAAKALAAVEAWVKEPSEAHRRACAGAAEATGYDTATGCLANAAFWSGGSLSAPHLPAVPPPENLTATGVTAALLLAAVTDPANAAATRSRFVALGAEVAGGKRA